MPLEIPAGLYLVATPIGNLGDISARALQILGGAQLILCEDTRHSAKLLAKFEIKAPLLSCHEHNEQDRVEMIASRIESGECIAMISDAGTPGISDPGFRLVRSLRAKGLPVQSIPGPCALIAALSISGLPTDSFRYFGFLPPKSAARKRTFSEYQDESATLVFYESTHRIIKFLDDLIKTLGPQRIVCVARELTKLHETVITGSAAGVLDQLQKGSQKGEFVVMIAKKDYQL
jgi:16S rRNA (cytidine1402-2'-O)-methyltransferase